MTKTKHRKTYTHDFRLAAVRRVLEGESRGAVGRDIGVNPSLVASWWHAHYKEVMKSPVVAQAPAKTPRRGFTDGRYSIRIEDKQSGAVVSLESSMAPERMAVVIATLFANDGAAA